jgi:hypothetical protein
MSQTAALTPLAARVQSVLRTESGFNDPLPDAALGLFSSADVELTERERDLLDWGAVVGLAFGLARMEDPCESLESVSARALDAALGAYEGYGEVPHRLRGEA